jgi:hypothetical protein
VNTKSSNLPSAAGILTISSAIMVAVAGVVSILGALNTDGGYGYGYISGTNILFWAAGPFEIMAFTVGLAGSAFQIKRRQLSLSTLSCVVLIISAGVMLIQSLVFGDVASSMDLAEVTWGNSAALYILALLALSILTLILSTLSIIFVAASRAEFRS